MPASFLTISIFSVISYRLVMDICSIIDEPPPCTPATCIYPAIGRVGPGQAGELLVRGPMVVPGYWNNPEATQK